MSLARAIETGDLADLPSCRDEDWRWSDLRGLIRALPAPSPVRMERMIVPAGETRRVDLAFASTRAEARVSRIAVEIGEGAGLVLCERYEGGDDSFAEVDLQIAVGRGARLHRLVIAADGEDAVSVSRADIALPPCARLAQSVLTGGARRQRLETRVSHPGAGASVRLDALYLLEGKRHADITTFVTHSGAGGVTDQLIKGVVR
ncbi:MAG: SufD family Fe-S cluster assembly protein, partial [Caulobacteraceae bacterium]